MHMQDKADEEVVLQLLSSVTSTLKPLVSAVSASCDSTAPQGGVALSPGAERVTGKLLQLSLEMGVKVSCVHVHSHGHVTTVPCLL